MSESMPYGEMVQKLTDLRAKYEQFIIDRERERIIKLLKPWLDDFDFDPRYVDELIALIKEENK